MALADALPDGVHVAFDTDAIIYYVEEHPTFLAIVAGALEKAITGRIRAHVSLVTLIEVLVGPVRAGNHDLAESYRDILTRDGGFVPHDLTQRAERSASIRARWNLETPDAIVAATAIEAGCTHLVTNDSAFRRVEELNVLVISDYV